MYFDIVDQGEHIIVQRGKDKSSALTAITEDDMYFNTEMIPRIKESILQTDNGDYKEVSSSKEINDLLGL